MSAPLAMTMGDPAGVGPLITLKTWQAFHSSPSFAFFVIAPFGVLQAASEHLGIDVPLKAISSASEAVEAFPNALPVLEIAGSSPPFGSPDVETAETIIRSIDLAVELTRKEEASAVVTNPISKALLYETGFGFPGHTEYLAALSVSEGQTPTEPVMMLVGGGLRVALATIHMSLRDVPNALSFEGLTHTAKTVTTSLKKDFGIDKPRIAFAGLNPHAGEGGALGQEEMLVINPTAHILRADGIDITNARPGDTVFAEMLEGGYDTVIAMYHDQGLAPLKTLDMWGGVNTSLGLPFVRTSPDHGTAYDAAASGKARPDSLIAAVKLAREIADNRANISSAIA